MRIAMVSDWYLPRLGGIEMQIHDLSVALKAAGHEVEVLTPFPGPENLDGVRIFRLRMGVGKPYRFQPSPVTDNLRDAFYLLEMLGRQGETSALHRLREQLRDGKYDVVHAQLGNTPFAYLAVNVAIQLGLRVVVTFHSVLGLFEQPIAFAISRAIGCQRWAGQAHLTAVSSLVAKNRARSIGSNDIGMLPNGTHAAFWQQPRSQSKPRAERPLKFFSAMRLHPRKRPFLLLTAMAALRAEASEAPCPVLHIAGGGHLQHALKQRIAQLGLEECVILTGRLERDEIADYLAQSDLFLMPSYLESFGVAALEARMSGVPVLAMRQAGAWDFLTPGTDSICAHNDKDFVGKLLGFARDDQVRDQLRAGATLPLTGYSWPEIVAQCQRLYES